MMKRKLRYIMVLMLMLALAVAAGCDQQEQAGNEASSSTKSEAVKKANEQKGTVTEKKAEEITVYFSNDNATALVACEKKVKDTGEDKYTQAINLLITETNEYGMVSMIPPKTKLRGLKVENGIAYVNFSRELTKNFNGGSAGEIMLVGAIVNTLTEFPEVKAVQIMVEGQVAETISGHMDTSEPLKRFNDLVKK